MHEDRIATRFQSRATVPAPAVDRRAGFEEDEIVASLDFGLARSADDFDGAFRLLHDNYVRGGYMAPHPSGRRLNIYNALPSTRVFVAKAGARVVGTVTLVTDSSLGLPMEQAYREELNALRARGRRLGEAATLTVDPDFRAVGLPILMRLFRLLTVHAARIARLDDLCLVVARHHIRFYRSFFAMRQIGPVRSYARINGTRVVFLRGDLGMVRALIRVGQSGLALGAPYDFMLGPPHYAEVLARLRRDLPASALTPDQVVRFFEGYGAESATALDLAAGLLSAVQRGAAAEQPAVSLRTA